MRDTEGTLSNEHPTIAFPPLAGITIYDPEDARRAAAAYRTWTNDEFQKYGIAPASVRDIIVKLDALHNLPPPTRFLAVLNEAQFLADVLRWCGAESGRVPASAPILDVLGEAKFLEAEGIGFLSIARDIRPGHAAETFQRAEQCYGTAAEILRRLITESNIEILERDAERRSQWQGWRVGFGQEVARVLRTRIRVCSHHVIDQVTEALSDAVRASASFPEVIRLQVELPNRGLHGEDRAAIATCAEYTNAVFRTQFADIDTAVTMIVNIANLAAIAGAWDRAIEYCDVVTAIHERGVTALGCAQVAMIRELHGRYHRSS